MQKDETPNLLHEARRILADDTLSLEERHRRVDDLLPELLRARFAAENVRLTDEARQAGLRSLLAASSETRRETSGPVQSLLSRFKGRRPPAWQWLGAAATVAGVLALFLLSRNRPQPGPRQVVSVPGTHQGTLSPAIRRDRSMTSVPPIPTPKRQRVVDRAPVRFSHPGTDRRIEITRVPDRHPVAPAGSRVPVGVLSEVMGEPRILPSGGGGPAAGVPRAIVMAGSKIVTGDADQATVRLKDGTTLRLGFNTVFRILPAAADRGRDSDPARTCELVHGTVLAKVVHQPGGHSLIVRTPSAAARVVGTEFGLKVRRKGDSRSSGPVEAGLWVNEGRVDFYNAHGRVECASMTESWASADSPPTAPRSIRYVRSVGLNTVVHSERLTLGRATERLAWEAGYTGLNVRDQLAPGQPFPWELPLDASLDTKEIRLDTSPTVLFTDPRSPAAKAGIQPGDVLLRIGTSRVRTAMSVQLAINATPPGWLDILLRRGGTERRVRLKTTLFDQSAFKGVSARERHIVDQGSRLFLAGDIGKARSAYNRAVRLTGSAAAMNNLGVILQYEGKIADAVRAYQDAARARPKEALYQVNLGLALLDIGNAERAVECFRSAAALAPKWEDPVEHTARAYADYLDLHAEALAAADNWIRRWPASPAAWTARAHALRLAGRPEEALQAAQQAIRISPVWQNAYQEAGDAYRATGDAGKGEQMYLRALRIDSGSSHLFSGAAFPLSMQGRLLEAITSIRCAITLEPEDFVFYAIISAFYRKLGKLDLAVASAKKAIEMEPRYGMGYDTLCEALMEANRLQEAEDAARRAIELSQDRAIAVNVLGRVLHSRGRIREAEKCFLDAIVLDPRFVPAYSNLESLYQRAGRLAEAEKMGRKEVELNPGNAESYWGLGMILVMLKRLPEAELNIRKAYALAPHNPEYARSVADVCRALDKVAEAEKYYLESLRIGPKVADTHLRFAGLLEQLGRLEEAEREFRAGAQLSPDKVLGLGQVALFQSRRQLADGGLAVAEQCLAMAKDDASRGMAKGFIGLVRIRRNEVVEAEKAFREAVALAPSANRWDRLADALEKLDRKADAIEAYRKALELDPNDAAAQNALKRLEPPEKR